jgi:hypothetical protein
VWLSLFPVAMGALVGLWIARLSTGVVMTVALPALLTVLSLVFGRGMRGTAHHLLVSGRRAQRTLRTVAARVRATAWGSAATTDRKVRVRLRDVDDFERGISEAEEQLEAAAEQIEREISRRTR